MAQTKVLEDLFLETLKDIYYAEKQLLKALPKMAKAANSNELRQAFETHRDETQAQVKRLDQVFGMMNKPARGKNCPAMDGLIEEGKEVMEELADSPALDAGILAGAQAVEHYEISRYGTLKAWAMKLGWQDAAKLLDETLKEEIKTDELLTQIAERAVNAEAQQGESEDEEQSSGRKSSGRSSRAKAGGRSTASKSTRKTGARAAASRTSSRTTGTAKKSTGAKKASGSKKAAGSRRGKAS